MNLIEIGKEYESLLDNWVCGNRVENASTDFFFKDGVICPDVWFNQEIRPLFLLKEAYKEESTTDFDMRRWMNGTYKTPFNQVNFIVFKKILQWTSTVFYNKEPSETISDLRKQYKWDNDLFKKIAFINIKKYDGKNFSDEKDLFAHVKAHKVQLQKQIELVDPTIVVCCGTIRFFFAIFEKLVEIKKMENKNNRIYELELHGHSIYLIDFFHPASYRETEIFYCNEIKNAIADIPKCSDGVIEE